jgi:hypothetical protein
VTGCLGEEWETWGLSEVFLSFFYLFISKFLFPFLFFLHVSYSKYINKYMFIFLIIPNYNNLKTIIFLNKIFNK